MKQNTKWTLNKNYRKIDIGKKIQKAKHTHKKTEQK